MSDDQGNIDLRVHDEVAREDTTVSLRDFIMDKLADGGYELGSDEILRNLQDTISNLVISLCHKGVLEVAEVNDLVVGISRFRPLETWSNPGHEKGRGRDL